MAKKTARREAAVDWLLEEDQPAIQYLALTQLVPTAAGTSMPYTPTSKGA